MAEEKDLDEVDVNVPQTDLPPAMGELAGDHIIVLDEILFHALSFDDLQDNPDLLENNFFHTFQDPDDVAPEADMFSVFQDNIPEIYPIDLANDEKMQDIYEEKAKQRAGEVVFPTSQDTIGFGVFSIYADDTNEGGTQRDFGFGLLNAFRSEGSIANVLNIGGEAYAGLNREYRVGSEIIKIFEEPPSDGKDLSYFAPKVVDDDLKVTGKALSKPLIERLKAMKDLRPDSKKDNNKVMSAKGGISPITQFYMMRYLGAYLSQNKSADAALPKTTTIDNGVTKLVLKRIDVERQSNIDLIDTFRSLIGGEIGETQIDEIFPFERLRTTYLYPSSYNRLWRNNPDDDKKIANAVEPSPTNPEVKESLSYGLLQKFYTVLKPQDRQNFLKAVASQLYEPMKSEVMRLPHSKNLNDASNEVKKNTSDSLVLPRLNGSYLIGEAMKVFAEIDPTDSNKDQLKLRMEPNNQDSRQIISDGAMITIPGWLVLASELKNRHKWISYMMAYPNYNDAAVVARGSLIGGGDGLEHIRDVVDYYTNFMLDEEKNTALDEESLYGMLSSEYEFIVSTAGDTVQATYADEDSVMTFFLNRKTLEKGIKESEFTDLLDDWKSDPADPNRIENKYIAYGEGVTVEAGGSSQPALLAYASETGLTTDSLSPVQARSFNSLGYIVEETMIHSAINAIETAEGVASVSDFDRIVIGMIGTNSFPGIAVSHSILHYQYLLALTTNPIKNWQAIDAGIFQQGSVLALESFFADPAKKTLFFLLNKKGYIDVGDFTSGSPKFFRVPESTRINDARFIGLLNSFSLIVISYYRLLFSQIRNRQVVNRPTQAKGRTSNDTVSVAYLWREMIADSEKNTPSPDIFGLILRWFSEAEDPVLEIPVWMPVMPSNMRQENRKMNASDVWNYLKWAYSTNSIDTEFFAEVAAAYHSSKVLSYLREGKLDESYAEVVERFVDSVDEDMGHAFLFSLLIDPNCPEPQMERPAVSDVFGVTDLTNGRLLERTTGAEEISESSANSTLEETEIELEVPVEPTGPVRAETSATPRRDTFLATLRSMSTEDNDNVLKSSAKMLSNTDFKNELYGEVNYDDGFDQIYELLNEIDQANADYDEIRRRLREWGYD